MEKAIWAWEKLYMYRVDQKSQPLSRIVIKSFKKSSNRL